MFNPIIRFFYVLMVIFLFFLTSTEEFSLPSTGCSNIGSPEEDLNYKHNYNEPRSTSWTWSPESQAGFQPFTYTQNRKINPCTKIDNNQMSNPSSFQEPSWWKWNSKDEYPVKGNLPSIVHFNKPEGSSHNHAIITHDRPRLLTPSQEIQQWLYHHNRFRVRYGARPLKWSQELVSASKRLTDSCVWQHTQNNPFGENMAAGQTSIQQVVEEWVTGPNEKNSYQGDNSQPSHFTQVVWLSTTEVGCSHHICQKVRGSNLVQSSVNFWACNYNPPGNVIGQFTKNVKARPGGNPM